MQVSNIISGLNDAATTTAKKSGNSAQSIISAMRAVDKRTSANSSLSVISAGILSQYDVTNITPTEYTEMIQQLYQAGVLSESDYRELTKVNNELSNDKIDSDEKLNLLDYYTNKVNEAKESLKSSLSEASKQKALGADLRRLDWIQKFATVQANPESAGLDLKG
jgi:hypothetical protein